MPCWEVKTIGVELEVADWEILKTAVRGLDRNAYLGTDQIVLTYRGTSVTVSRGEVRHQVGQEGVVGEIKRAYAKAVIESAAARFRWNVKTTAENKLQVGRRF